MDQQSIDLGTAGCVAGSVKEDNIIVSLCSVTKHLICPLLELCKRILYCSMPFNLS